MPEFELPITKEEYDTAGSKFITFPPGNPAKQVGNFEYREIECGMIDWETPGKSMKLPVTVTEEGSDFGKEDKVSFGVDKKGIWKGKELYEAVTGKPMPVRKGVDGKQHPYIDPMAVVGKMAIGAWQMQKGYPGGDQTQAPTYYPKLVNILKPGEKPVVESLEIG